MSKIVKTHDENRSKVCLLCFQKGNSMVSLISRPTDLHRVKTFFIEDYNASDLKMPSGLCAACRKKLERKEMS